MLKRHRSPTTTTTTNTHITLNNEVEESRPILKYYEQSDSSDTNNINKIHNHSFELMQHSTSSTTITTLAIPTTNETKTPISESTNACDTTPTLTLSLLFISSMIIHELALESASTKYSSIIGANVLADIVTLFQFTFCLLLPLSLRYYGSGNGNGNGGDNGSSGKSSNFCRRIWGDDNKRREEEDGSSSGDTKMQQIHQQLSRLSPSSSSSSSSSTSSIRRWEYIKWWFQKCNSSIRGRNFNHKERKEDTNTTDNNVNNNHTINTSTKNTSIKNSTKKGRGDYLSFLGLSVLVYGSTALANHSLAYVDIPTKVVFKSAKLIPTMIVSTILNNSSSGTQKARKGSKVGKGGGRIGGGYHTIDYISALLICVGAAGFAYGGGGDNNSIDTTSSSKGSNLVSISSSSENNIIEHRWYGIALLSTAIACDALVPNIQQSLMTGSGVNSDSNGSGNGITAERIMINVNAVGTMGVLSYMLLGSYFSSSYSSHSSSSSSTTLSSTTLSSTIVYVIQNPNLLFHLIVMGLGLAFAVLSYTNLIRMKGSVVAVSVATLRKVFTVILSYVFFPKPVLITHVISGFVVLSGILIKLLSKRRGR